MRALSIAATGMAAQQTNVEVIANNLANMNTTGLQVAARGIRGSALSERRTPGAQSSDSDTLLPSGIQLGAGVRTAAVSRITTQGALQQTSNPYDVAVQGSGYFRVTMPTARSPIRARAISRFRPQGQIVTQDGYAVAPGISVPPDGDHVQINAQGQVLATVPGQTAPQTAGQLELDRFPNEAGLNAHRRQSLHLETAASGAPQAGVPGSTGYGTIQQGYLEILQRRSGGGDHLADHRAARL